MKENQELSERAKNWLSKHNLTEKAKGVKEFFNRLEFYTTTERKNFVTLHTILLSNYSWECHVVHIKAASTKWV